MRPYSGGGTALSFVVTLGVGVAPARVRLNSDLETRFPGLLATVLDAASAQIAD